MNANEWGLNGYVMIIFALLNNNGDAVIGYMSIDNSQPDNVQESANVHKGRWCVTNISRPPMVQSASKTRNYAPHLKSGEFCSPTNERASKLLAF